MTLRAYLQTQVLAHPNDRFNPAAFILKHGRPYTAHPIKGTQDPDAFLKAVQFKTTGSYCEGFATDGQLVLPHAWNVFGEQTGDPFWGAAIEYYGVCLHLPECIRKRTTFKGVFDPEFLLSFADPWGTLEPWVVCEAKEAV